MAPGTEPSHLSIPETALADLKARLAMTRLPDQAPGGPWTSRPLAYSSRRDN